MSSSVDAVDAFAAVFGDERGTQASTVFGAHTNVLAQQQYDEFAREISANSLLSTLSELMTAPQLISSRALATSLRDLVCARVLANTEDLEGTRARLIGEATGLRRQSAETVIAGGYPQQLHLWPTASAHGTWNLVDLDSAGIRTVCGIEVWKCRRVHRGAWQEEQIRDNGDYESIERCRLCAQHAQAYADTQETSMYPPLDGVALARTLAEARALLLRIFERQRPHANPSKLSQRLHAAAAKTYLLGVRRTHADCLVGNRFAYERALSLGGSDYASVEHELRRAGVASAVENVVARATIRNLVGDDEALSSANEFAQRLRTRILSESGVSSMYVRGHVPRPSWARP